MWVPIAVDDLCELDRLHDENFPVANNFKIKFFLRSGTLALQYSDTQLGVLADFPWWDEVERDLRSWSLSDIPVGSRKAPYCDIDQSWKIMIWRRDGYIFIMQGDGETFQYGSRVEEGNYRAEWRRALDSVRAKSD